METQITLRIDWSELDLFGHVNNVMFMKYIQASRLNFNEQIGLMKLYETQKIGFMVAETTCQFKKPLNYPGNVSITTKLLFSKNTSFSLEHTIFDESGNIAAIGKDVLVVYDFNTNEKCIIPKDVLQKMNNTI